MIYNIKQLIKELIKETQQYHYVEYKQQKGENNSKDNKELINKFIKALKKVDGKHDIVAIIRGGCDKNVTCLLDAPEIHAALLTVKHQRYVVLVISMNIKNSRTLQTHHEGHEVVDGNGGCEV